MYATSWQTIETVLEWALNVVKVKTKICQQFVCTRLLEALSCHSLISTVQISPTPSKFVINLVPGILTILISCVIGLWVIFQRMRYSTFQNQAISFINSNGTSSTSSQNVCSAHTSWRWQYTLQQQIYNAFFSIMLARPPSVDPHFVGHYVFSLLTPAFIFFF